MASKYPFTRLVLCIALFSWVGGRLSHGPDNGGKIEYLSRQMSWIHLDFAA
jgi:hypothetical protein